MGLSFEEQQTTVRRTGAVNRNASLQIGGATSFTTSLSAPGSSRFSVQVSATFTTADSSVYILLSLTGGAPGSGFAIIEYVRIYPLEQPFAPEVPDLINPTIWQKDYDQPWHSFGVQATLVNLPWELGTPSASVIVNLNAYGA